MLTITLIDMGKYGNSEGFAKTFPEDFLTNQNAAFELEGFDAFMVFV